MTEIAATFGFAAGLVVGWVIAGIREARKPWVLNGLRPGEGFREWSNRVGGEAMRRQAERRDLYKTRDTKHGI